MRIPKLAAECGLTEKYEDVKITLMVADRKCKNCAYWKPTPEDHGGGQCQSENIVEDWYDDACYRPDMLVYPYSEGGYFWTGPEFGCVHWIAPASSESNFADRTAGA
jgi:hypothetical protein